MPPTTLPAMRRSSFTGAWCCTCTSSHFSRGVSTVSKTSFAETTSANAGFVIAL